MKTGLGPSPRSPHAAGSARAEWMGLTISRVSCTLGTMNLNYVVLSSLLGRLQKLQEEVRRVEREIGAHVSGKPNRKVTPKETRPKETKPKETRPKGAPQKKTHPKTPSSAEIRHLMSDGRKWTSAQLSQKLGTSRSEVGRVARRLAGSVSHGNATFSLRTP